MIYFRLFFVFLWLFMSCTVGLVLCVFRWGDLNLDRSFGRLFAWGAIRFSGVKVEVEGLEHLEAQQPCIYVANHQSGLDMATFGSIYPHRTVVVGKKELLYIPFFGLYFKAAGNIVLNRQKRVSAIAGLSEAAKFIRKNKASVWIFPEGTRNRTDEPMMPFKKGAFYMALQAQVPIVPVVSSPLYEVVSWKEKRLNGGRVRLRVLPPIDTSTYGPKEVERLSNDVRAKMVEGLKGL
jgi:1-acyl-sn-glycerol-3-phosphate acyltransferase